MFKVNKKGTKRQWRHFVVFIANFQQISHLVVMFILLICYSQITTGWNLVCKISWEDRACLFLSDVILSTPLILMKSIFFLSGFSFIHEKFTGKQRKGGTIFICNWFSTRYHIVTRWDLVGNFWLDVNCIVLEILW